MLKTDPAVFAVGNDYQIMAPVEADCLYWVEVGDEKFYDDANGILRSACRFHRAAVPMTVLDAAKEYAVCTRPVADRAPYSPTVGETERKTYRFMPVTTATPRVYCVSDVHCAFDKVAPAAKAFGKIDLLIMNGDIPDCAYCEDFYVSIYGIAAQITGGEIPIVFARGNHDCRGYIAEHYAENCPTMDGKTYYTFRLGAIWGVVLDCGEDKPDDYPDYRGTVACHGFRQRQTAFLKQIIANAGREYNAPGVKMRWVICHNPFVHRMDPPFDIEQELYGEWITLLRQMKPDYMICGHLHREEVHLPGDGWDTNGTLCKTVVGCVPGHKEPWWRGMGLTFTETGCKVTYNETDGTVNGEETLLL